MTHGIQQELFDSRAEMTLADLIAFMNAGSPRKVEIKLTRNRVSMLSMNFAVPGTVRIRMHEGYLKAPPAIFKALREYVRTRDRDKWKIAARFVHEIHCDVHARQRPARLATGGRVYDLKELYEEVNHEFFNGRVSCVIGWGRPRRKSRRWRWSKHIRFGSWHGGTRTVRVHPRLDDPRVPREFVRYIVFHEMLHAVVPETVSGCRRRIHSAQFKALEKGFPNFREMQQVATRLVKTLL
jgi:predicted metal-dependent hydrolase